MYATCLFCNKSLGANETFETFPIGKRLAFDAAKGRLWVVCPHCERWNLTPLEDRWEAIESAEKLFHDARQRVSTDNIGLAKLREGLELVRIGEPLRPEFAAWRYGDQFGRRRRRQIVIAGAGLAGLGAVVAGGVAMGVGLGGFAWVIGKGVQAMLHGSPASEVARIPMADRAPLRVLRGQLAETTLDVGSDDSLVIDVRHRVGRTRLEGRDAERATALL